MAEPSNKHDGVFAGETRVISDVDVKQIPPNKPRPEQVGSTKHLFGHFSD